MKVTALVNVVGWDKTTGLERITEAEEVTYINPQYIVEAWPGAKTVFLAGQASPMKLDDESFARVVEAIEAQGEEVAA